MVGDSGRTVKPDLGRFGGWGVVISCLFMGSYSYFEGI